MPSRLPVTGGDLDAWGPVLNDYLTKTVGQVPGAARVFYLDAYGADPTGVATSDAAWAACYTDAAASVLANSGAMIVLGAGTYRFSVNTVAVTDTRIGFRGQGRIATNITTTGTGGVLLKFTGATGGTAHSAPVSGFTAYGWDSGGGVTGIEYNHRNSGTLTDVKAYGFGGSGARGFWFHDPTGGNSEGSLVQVVGDQCTVNFDFDADGLASQGSFDWGNFYLYSITSTVGGANSVAMRVANGQHIYGGSIHLTGSIGSSNASFTATVLQVGNSGTDTAFISSGHLTISMECVVSTGTVFDFQVNTAAGYGIVHETGSASFISTSGTFTAGARTAGVFTMAGYLNSPLFSGAGTLTALGTGGTLFTYVG